MKIREENMKQENEERRERKKQMKKIIMKTEGRVECSGEAKKKTKKNHKGP